MLNKKGFTLIEIMVVVAIISIDIIKCQKDKYPSPGIFVNGSNKAAPFSISGFVNKSTTENTIIALVSIIPRYPTPIAIYPKSFTKPRKFLAIESINFKPIFVLSNRTYIIGIVPILIIGCKSRFLRFKYKKIDINIRKIIALNLSKLRKSIPKSK